MRRISTAHPGGAQTRRLGLAGLAALAAASTSAVDASGAGLYFSDRGVRPMGRAGAFVAGADDLGAIWYNPAGLADAGTSVLVDFGYLHFTDSYKRELQLTNAQGTVEDLNNYPTVNGSAPPLPIPTIAGSLKLDHAGRFTIAGGFLAPQIALASYPATVDGQPSPGRYSLGSFDGSLLGVIGGWIAWKPIEQLRIGVGALGLVGQFQTTVTFSTCPALNLVCALEEPSYDANAQITVRPIVAPTANGGITWIPFPALRFGASGQAPMVISAPAQLQIQLPQAQAFDTAQVNGSNIHVTFTLPAVARLGIEVRPIPTFRIEATYVREFWSEQKSIVAQAEGMTVSGITGLATPVSVPTIVIPRNFQDTNSYRLGAEYTFRLAGLGFDARAGLAYEESAVPVSYVSLLSLDMNKLTTSLGAGVHVGKHWRFDAVYAHLFCDSVYVSPSVAQIPHINPLNGNAPLVPVNGGTYTAEADLIGLGLNYLF
jgi:long-chain fatty acid transport protein